MQRNNTPCRLLVPGAVLLSLVTGLCLTAPAELIRPSEPYEQITLILPGAAEDGGTITIGLHSRGGELGRGWADGPGGADTRIDHTLQRKGETISGDLRAVLGPVEYRYTVQAETGDGPGALTGSYEGDYGPLGTCEDLEGEVRGEIRARPVAGEPVRFAFDLWSLYTRWGHIRHPSIRFTLRDGQAVEGEFVRRPGHHGYAGTFDGGTLRYDGDRLGGEVKATVLEGDAARGQYTFAMDAEVRAGYVIGTVTTRKDGNTWGTRPLFGQAVGSGQPSPTQAVYVVSVRDALTGDQPLTLYMDCDGSEFGEALARGGNNQTHKVDPSGLSAAGGRLRGNVKVDLAPGGGFPPGERELGCEFRLEARVAGDGAVSGSYTGRYGRRREAKGDLNGRIRSAGHARSTAAGEPR